MGFTCVINRNRDLYQVPLALHEAGLLTRFVTDFYAPDRLRGLLPGPLRRRHVDGLPSSVTKSALRSFFVQTSAQLRGKDMAPVFRRTDAMLGEAAGRVLLREGGDLYCYSGYLPPLAEIPDRTRIVVFEFHPDAALGAEILADDARSHPDIIGGVEQELNRSHQAPGEESWRRATHVVCASSMTRRSLMHAGCDAKKIAVIPYGFEPSGDPIALRPDGPCEFLFVGQGVQRKGLHHLLLAWQQLAPKNARLSLVCARIDPAMKALAEGSNVSLFGRQEATELAALYDRSDVFVMPSLIEGFGLVYLEALARGCHVIGTDNTGLPDLALGPEAATLIEPGNIGALAEVLREMIARKQAGAFDPHAIAAAAGQRPWSQFRNEIAGHARAVLASREPRASRSGEVL